jgi:hypothetical protein
MSGKILPHCFFVHRHHSTFWKIIPLRLVLTSSGLSSRPIYWTYGLGLIPGPVLCLTPRHITRACHLCLPTGPVAYMYLSSGPVHYGLPPGPFVRACYLFLSPGGWGVTVGCYPGLYSVLSPVAIAWLSPGPITWACHLSVDPGPVTWACVPSLSPLCTYHLGLPIRVSTGPFV